MAKNQDIEQQTERDEKGRFVAQDRSGELEELARRVDEISKSLNERIGAFHKTVCELRADMDRLFDLAVAGGGLTWLKYVTPHGLRPALVEATYEDGSADVTYWDGGPHTQQRVPVVEDVDAARVGDCVRSW